MNNVGCSEDKYVFCFMATSFMQRDICRKLMTSVLLWCSKYQFNGDLIVVGCYVMLTGTYTVSDVKGSTVP